MTIHTNVGYGIDVTEMPLIPENILRLAARCAPDAYESLLDECTEEEFLAMDGEELKDCVAEFTMCGIADILAEAITNETGINVVAGIDDDGYKYVYVEPSFPWDRGPRVNYTREELDEMLIKFAALCAPNYKVTPEFIEYQSLYDDEY